MKYSKDYDGFIQICIGFSCVTWARIGPFFLLGLS